MTTVTGDYTTYDTSYLTALAAATLSANSATQFVLTASPYVVTVTGTGFSYKGNHPKAGTITGITVQDNSEGRTQTTTWSNLSVSAAALWNAIATANVTAFDGLLYQGHDTFTFAGTQYDVAHFAGVGGNDTFNMQGESGVGPDSLSDAGSDNTFNYAGVFNADSQINGGTGNNNTLNISGNLGRPTISHITNIQKLGLGSGYDYDITWSVPNDLTVDGSALGAGNSLTFNGGVSTAAITMLGGAGSNTFVLGRGNDSFVGGSGADTVSLANATGAATVNLNDTAPQALGGGLGTDTLTSVENIAASSHNDTLTGTAQDNLFLLGTGKYTLNGGGGNDTVSFQNVFSFYPYTGVSVDLRAGGTGATGTFTGIDNAIGTNYGDTFIGNAGDNIFDGVDDNTPVPDTITYQYAGGPVTVTESLTDPHTFTASGADQGTDTLMHMTQIIGSSYNDTFYLSSNWTYFDNWPQINGHGGTDTVSYAYATAGITADLRDNYGYFTGMTNLTGSSYDDTLTGNTRPGIINGGAGNDMLSSAFYPNGPTGDTLIGGAGNDTAGYSLFYSNYDITHNANGSVSISADDTPAVSDVLWGIENLKFIDQTVAISMADYHRTFADFDGDGSTDILLRSPDGQLADWGGNGVGTGDVGGNPGNGWNFIGTGDFNIDGKADIVWQGSDGTVAVWLMHGTKLSGGGVVGNPGLSWKIVGTADMNNDGNADILWQNADGTIAAWLMNGTSVVGGGIVGNPGSSWKAIGTGDFNGDGNTDILWQNNDGTVAVWLMNGTNVTGGGIAGNLGSDWRAIGTGDFDGDGNTDILWQNSDGTAAIWMMNGATVFGGGIAGSNPGAAWRAISVGDYNGDGRADILWQNTDGTTAVWSMSGTSVIGGNVLDIDRTAGWRLVAGTS